MAQSTVPALPAQVIFSAQASSGARGLQNGNGDNQAFAKALDQRRNGASPSNTGPAHPQSPDAPKAQGASNGAQATEKQAQSTPPASSGAEATGTQTSAPSGVANDAAADAEGVEVLTDASSGPLNSEESTDSATPSDDPLQASLAGLPAALAALLTGNGAASPQTSSPTRPQASPQRGLMATAQTTPDQVAADGKGAPVTPADQANNFATALGQASEASIRTQVQPAATSETGPASRASDTAQLAAAATAGERGAADPTPGAGVLWNPVHAPQGHREDTALRLQVTQPPDHPAWAESVANRVTWMVGQRESTAELVLTPPQLGRVEVTLSVNGDHTTAQFVAATPAAREALEQAMPRLRDVLAGAGITLTDSGVSTSDQRGASGDSNRQGTHRQEASALLSSDTATRPGPWLQRGQGLVDTFA